MSIEFEKQLNNRELLPLIEEYSLTIGDFSLCNGVPCDSKSDNIFTGISKNLLTKKTPVCEKTLSSGKYVIMPGLCDVHVHFREPGFSYKETIKTGSLAGARGGYTAVCTMPNLNPVPDTVENLNAQLDIIRRDAVISVYPYGAITKCEMGKELADLDALAPYVCAFSDDGRGVQNDDMMRIAMLKAKSLGKVITAHCEVNELLRGGYIHEGEYAKSHGHLGICSESEYAQVERDLKLVEETGAKYHVCHVSTKESVALIREAKRNGLDVTCETAPHYLIMTDVDLKEDGNYKMNPPVRSEEDRLALIEGIKDGTVDIIATDHAPHSEEEKSKGLKQSPFGIVGLETAFALLYTNMVKTGIISLERLVNLVCIAPRARFNIPLGKLDFTVFEVGEEYKINKFDFASKGKNTPFHDRKVYGKCVLTVKGGKIIYQR